MKVLVDYHHHDLWESMRLLCARLGWTLYRPIGMDWFEQGYWNHERKFHGDTVARQYLEPWGTDLPVLGWNGPSLGHFQRYDRSHQQYTTLVTLDAARDLKPDIVISSLAHNHEGLHRFATEVGATFGLQVGNVRFSPQDMEEDRWDLAAFGLVSGLMPVEPPKPHVVYHQEFQTEDRLLLGFNYHRPPRRGLVISSFVQCYPQDTPSYDYWQKTVEQAPGFDWRVYGAYGEAPEDRFACGNLDQCHEVALGMRESDIAWHAKRWSDGYGHVIHNWFASGRPVLGFRDYYKDQLAGRLWLEGETAWDIGSRTPGEVADLLRRFDQDEDFHIRACEASAARFRQVVDFDEEEQQIRALFAQVLP